MTDLERQAHVESLRKVRQKRLDVLELQAAQLGNTTPPHVTTEIEQLKADLAALEPVTQPTISNDVRQLLRRYDYAEYMQNVMAGTIQRLTMLEESFKDDKKERAAEKDKNQQAVQVDRSQRESRQYTLNVWLTLLTGLVLITLTLVVFK